jgi:release factor glutamine methyltransferase
VPETLSVGARLDAAAAALARAGHLRARHEARALWAAVSDTSPGAVWLERRAPAAATSIARFERAVAQRVEGVQFAYAVGRTPFRTLDLLADPRALIPRPETEGLVELVLGALRRHAAPGLVADIGTGCGCIALSLAVEARVAGVVAVERDAAAAALARENVARVRPPVPVEVREGDLLTPLIGERFCAVVANPPYLTQAELGALDPAVRLEPRAALDGGPDGLAPTRLLLAEGGALLAPGGFLALEIDARRASAVEGLARRHAWGHVAIHDDLFGRPRYAIAYREAP